MERPEKNREIFMRLASFLTTSLTLSRIRSLVLNEEKLLADLLAAQEELHQYRKVDQDKKPDETSSI